MGCIFQLLTDGLLYETLECYWIHYFIPLLAIKDVRRAVTTLQSEIAKLLIVRDDDGICFDASEYFHLSYRLAAVFSNLWESVVVRSYHTTFPPVHISHDANNSITESKDAIFCINLLSAVLRRAVAISGTMMLYFGTLNIRLQKMAITVAQPLVLAGICWMYYEMSHFKWIVIFPCIIPLAFIYSQFRKSCKSGSKGDTKIRVDCDDAISSQRGRCFGVDGMSRHDISSECVLAARNREDNIEISDDDGSNDDIDSRSCDDDKVGGEVVWEEEEEVNWEIFAPNAFESFVKEQQLDNYFDDNDDDSVIADCHNSDEVRRAAITSLA